jgi:outer membrane protein TolC
VAELDRELMVLNARRLVLSSLLDAAQARYEARAVPLADVFRVTTQLNRVDQDVAAVRRNRRIAVARLNGLLNRTASAAISPSLHRDPVITENDASAWLASALENRPAFAALRARSDLVVAQRRAADAQSDPVWSLGFAYMARFQPSPVGDDLFSLVLGIELPFFANRQTDARLDELTADAMRIEHDRDEVVRQLRAEIETTLEAMARDAHRNSGPAARARPGADSIGVAPRRLSGPVAGRNSELGGRQRGRMEQLMPSKRPDGTVATAPSHRQDR